MTTRRQNNFASGEISPAFAARTDSNKWHTGLRTLRNCHLLKPGGFTNRGGLQFIDTLGAGSTRKRLIPMITSETQHYVLEVGNSYTRVFDNGATLKKNAFTIMDVQRAVSGSITFYVPAGHGTGISPDNDNFRFTVSGVAGMTELNGNTYMCTGVAVLTPQADGGYSALYDLRTTAGTIVDTSAYTAFSTGSYGRATLNQTITAITQANPGVVSVADHGLTDGDQVYISGVAGMTEVNGRTFIVAGRTQDTFQLTDVNGSNVNTSSYTAYSSAGTISRIVKFATDYTESELPDIKYHQLGDFTMILAHTGDPVYEFNIESLYGYNEFTYKTFQHQPFGFFRTGDGVQKPLSFTGATSGGTTYYIAITSIDERGEESDARIGTITPTALPTDITITPPANGNTPVKYNVYRKTFQNNGLYGFIGSTYTTVFTFNNETANYDINPPQDIISFVDSSNQQPAVVGGYQQRLAFGRRPVDKSGIFLSKSALPFNFLTDFPVTDSSTIVTRLTNRNPLLRNFAECDFFYAICDSGVLVFNGNDAGILTPTSCALRDIGAPGGNEVRPLAANGVLIYVDSKGQILRGIVDSKKPVDFTVFSHHLFKRKTLEYLAWQTTPESIVWVVRSDGTLLGMSFDPENGLMGWHRHDTDGVIEDVCIVPLEGDEVVYLAVKRTINGSTFRYLERLLDRDGSTFSDIEDCRFLDSCLSYDGENETTSHTMTLSGGSTWASGETGLTLTSSASYFTSADIGNAIVLQDSSGRRVKCTITAYTSGTVVTVTTGGFSNDPEVDPLTAFTTVPTSLRSTAVSTWGKAVDDVSGLWHLVGENVTVIADGVVLHNPNRSDLSTKTVSATGTITLASTYVKIHVGLPYISDAETLELDTPNRSKLMGKVTVQCEYTRGMYAGRTLPADTSPLTNLQPLGIYNTEITTQTPLTGRKDVVINSNWDFFGRVALRQVDPLPMTVLSILPEGMYPPKG